MYAWNLHCISIINYVTSIIFIIIFLKDTEEVNISTCRGGVWEWDVCVCEKKVLKKHFDFRLCTKQRGAETGREHAKEKDSENCTVMPWTLYNSVEYELHRQVWSNIWWKLPDADNLVMMEMWKKQLAGRLLLLCQVFSA